MQIRIKKSHPNAVIPSYATEGDAGMDLIAVEVVKENDWIQWFNTGLQIEIPENYMGLIFPRSSISKKALSLANSVGIIDSGYRGDIQVRFNKIPHEFNILQCGYNIGDKIAQLVIVPIPTIELIEVEELSISQRGEGGFGHTGN